MGSHLPARCYRAGMIRRCTALAALLLALAACGSSAPAPLTASQLAHKIPGCHHFLAQTPSVLATGDVTCDAPGSGPLGSVEVITFASSGNEQKWILGQGGSSVCCIQGHLWAADYIGGTNEFPRITRALGGRVVSG